MQPAETARIIGRIPSWTQLVRLSSFLVLLWTCIGALAQEAPSPTLSRSQIWDLRLGAPVSDMPDDFVDFACGANGSPSTPIKGWAEVARCRSDARGLREVFFRYDDEAEYWARANDVADDYAQMLGTKAYDFPISASALIDANATVRGLRIASDPRSGERRDDAYLLRNFLMGRYGRDGWTCEEEAPAEGESAVDGVFVKQQCEKSPESGLRASITTRHLRRAGQAAVDPRTGRATRGQFESTVRFALLKSD